MIKHSLIIITLILISLTSIAQKKGYKNLANIPPPHYSNTGDSKKFYMNGFLLSPTMKYIVIDYGRKASTLAIFTFPDFDLVGMQRIEKSVELSQTYFASSDSLLFVKTDRYAPDYTMIRVHDIRAMVVPCEKTPRGCPTEAAGFATIKTYSPDKKYILQRAGDKYTLEVFIKE